MEKSAAGPVALVIASWWACLLPPLAGAAVPGSLDVHWLEGAEDCTKDSQPLLQVHQYEPQTYILRQSPCADYEANFLYLLIGSQKALLIDSGAVEDGQKMPLAQTILDLLPDMDGARLPLLIAHTHGHSDHRAGDGQFASLESIEVVPSEIEGVRKFFGFAQWPEGEAHIDLGGRLVAVIPVPGHEEAHVLFHDARTEILFSGDFLLPGRLLIQDLDAYRGSAVRAVRFVENRPVSHVLGAHIELDATGAPYAIGSGHHPNERRLELAKADLLALPAALAEFNGFYARHEHYILTHPLRNLLALGTVVAAVLVLGIWGLRRWLRRRRAN